MTVQEIINEYNEGKTHILTKEEEIEIFNYLYTHNEDKELIQTILLKYNIGLIKSICKNYNLINNVDIKDIFQYAHMGLISAIENFDITKNTKFSSYATFWIKQTINRELQKTSKVSQPISVKDIRKKYYEVERELSNTLNREVKAEEIAKIMKIDYNELLMILASSDANVMSLNKEINDEELGDFIIDDTIEVSDKQELINEALEILDGKEKEVMSFRYGYDDGIYHTLDETGVKLKLTRQRVQQLEKSALNKMRKYIEKKNA